MAMASGLYGITYRDVFDTSQLAVNIDADTFKMLFVTDTYTPDFNLHDFYADVTNEVTGTNVPSGGTATAGESIVASAGLLTIDANDLSIGSATASSIRGRVITDDTLASDPLILATTFGADYSPAGGTLLITEAAQGWCYIDFIP